MKNKELAKLAYDLCLYYATAHETLNPVNFEFAGVSLLMNYKQDKRAYQIHYNNTCVLDCVMQVGERGAVDTYLVIRLIKLSAWLEVVDYLKHRMDIELKIKQENDTHEQKMKRLEIEKFIFSPSESPTTP